MQSKLCIKGKIYVKVYSRMAGEIYDLSDKENGLLKHIECEEYMLRVINAFLSGGDYLPCRQIFQKHILLRGMVRNYVQINRLDLALERAEMLFAGRMEFLKFLSNQKDKTTLLFENNDSAEYQMHTKYQLDCYANDTIEMLKALPEYENDTRIKELLQKYDLE
jgi:hypothetical protein